MDSYSNWSSFTARRFRGFHDISLEDLGSLNILVGANDTGKTSLLEAIFLLSGSGNLLLPVNVQGFRDYPVDDLDDLAHLFHECDTASGIELAARTAAPVSYRRLSITVPQLGSPGNTAAFQGPDSDSHGLVPVTAQSSTGSFQARNSLRYDLFISRNGKSSSHSGSLLIRAAEQFVKADASLQDIIIPARFLGKKIGHDADAVGRVVAAKKKRELLECLRFVNPRVQDIALDGSRVFLDVGLARMLPINMFGTGMVRACSMLACCVLGVSRILLIDEVSSGLHHKALSLLLRAMLKYALQNRVQIFATTHSSDVLQHLAGILARDEMAAARQAVACYALQRDSSGKVRSYRYGYQDLDHQIRQGIEIR